MRPFYSTSPLIFLTLLALVGTIGFAYSTGMVIWHPKWPTWGWVWMGKMFFLTVFSEQVFFRIFLQDGLKKAGVPRFITPPLAALGFAIVHLPAGLAYATASLIVGLAHAYSYQWTKNLLVPMAIHMAVNTIHFTLFTYPFLK